MEAKDRTEQAKEIIAMVQAGELGYEDMQIYIENILLAHYKKGKRIGEANTKGEKLSG